jgi:hypothetical protein
MMFCFTQMGAARHFDERLPVKTSKAARLAFSKAEDRHSV